MNKPKKTSIFWIEGLIVFFNQVTTYNKTDLRKIGYENGQTIIGLYLCELILKYALDRDNINYKNVHNLKYLFSKLPHNKQTLAEEKYIEILSSQFQWTWTFARSLESFLKNLGTNPIKDTRYFWRMSHRSKPLMLSPGNLRTIIYSLLIILHDYPQILPAPMKKYDTSFVDIEKSLVRSPKKRKQGKNGNWLKIHWAEGLLDYFNSNFTFSNEDRRHIGISVRRQVIGLHLVELLLKYALEDEGVNYDNNHNLHLLFSALPAEIRQKSERKYSEIHSEIFPKTWDFTKSIDCLLEYYGEDAITESRYFWEPPVHREGDNSILFSRWILYTLVISLFISLHDYPERIEGELRRYNTEFMSFDPPNSGTKQ